MRSTVQYCPKALCLGYELQNHPKVLISTKPIRRFMVVCEVQYHPKGLRLDYDVQ